MRYSLLHRFQGALLGAALGERVGNSIARSRSQATRSSTPTAALQDGSSQFEQRQKPSATSPWRKVAVQLAEDLIRTGTWTAHLLHGPDRASSLISTDTELALATLPLSLFLHDDEPGLRQALVEIVQGSPEATQAADSAFAVGSTIAQTLKEQLEPPSLSHLLSRFTTSSPKAPESTLVEQLKQVQRLLQDRVDLQTAAERLRASKTLISRGADEQAAIGLAFYCFLTTPDDWRLAVLRMAHCPQASPRSCALTGALSGAYNSLAGIPLEWTLAQPSGELSKGDMMDSDIAQLANRLFSAWAGAYDADALVNPAIAAPDVIRPR